MYVLNALQSILALEASVHHKPIVFWHGMGDSYNSTGLQQVQQLIHEFIPNVPIHSIYMDLDDDKDQQKSLLGNANEQVDIACEQVKQFLEQSVGSSDEMFNFLGFSQGGVFGRALIERCEGINPYNFITFGSPHSGVKDGPVCEDSDWVCKKRNQLLRSQVWKVQDTVLSAQYFRDPYHYDDYINYSKFLNDINNEKPNQSNQTYIDNFCKLNKFVMIKFDQDETVVPKESAWFQDIDISNDQILPFNQTTFFKKELIGLKKLYNSNSIEFLSINDKHMVIDDDFLVNEIILKYL